MKERLHMEDLWLVLIIGFNKKIIYIKPFIIRMVGQNKSMEAYLITSPLHF